jgi:phosphoribosylformylglycinamidine synthase
MDFLHNGVPKPVRPAVYEVKREKKQKPVKFNSAKLSKSLKAALSDLNICSKEWIIRQYDHEVQGQTIIKPLQGNNIEASGPGDAAVIWPYTVVKGTKKAVVLSNGLNPQYGKINVYKMAAGAIEEALRNAVAVGGDINKLSLLDNFCWGNPSNPKILGSLVRAANACYDMSKAFGVPFISGKDSLHNEYSIGAKKYSIPPALLISAMGIIENAQNTVTMPFKEGADRLFILGYTRNELGGSVFSKINKIKDGVVPSVYPKESKLIMEKIHTAINKGLIEACHDVSEGGIAAAVSEMAFAGQKGAYIDIDKILTDGNLHTEDEYYYSIAKLTPSEILFSESNGRFVIEVKNENAEKIKTLFKGSAICEAGFVREDGEVIFESLKEKIKIKERYEKLLKCWKSTINW